MFCTACGKQIAESSNYCPWCGQIVVLLTQREAIDKIIQKTPLNSLNVDVLSYNARERSDLLYEERQQRQAQFDPFKVRVIEGEKAHLISVEKYFLKSMDGQAVYYPNVCAYWVYEYSLDFSTTMSKLIANGYLKTTTEPNELVKFLTAEKMHDILKKYGKPCSGKKNDLLKRLISDLTPEELTAAFSPADQRYTLTKEGRCAVMDLPKSATKDLEFEDECLSFLYEGDFDGAYRQVCKREANKILPRGLGIDWNVELKQGLSESTKSFYVELYKLKLSSVLPDRLLPYEVELKASIILSDMLGEGGQKGVYLFNRITKWQNLDAGAVFHLIQAQMQQDRQLHNFIDLYE